MNILSPVSEAKTSGRSNIPDMIKQQIAEQIHGPQADFMQNTHIQNEYSAVDLLQSKPGPSQSNIRETPQTGTAEYSINDKKLRTYTKTEPTPVRGTPMVPATMKMPEPEEGYRKKRL